MNRIYQGRVVAVETCSKKTSKSKHFVPESSNIVNDWEDVLWEHHQLFQDAVNYYLVALLAMATQPNNKLFKIRQEIAKENSELQIWRDFRRQGLLRSGLCRSVAPYLTPDDDQPSLEKCFNAILSGNTSSPEILDACVQQVLNTCKTKNAKAIQQESKSNFPRLCDPRYKSSYPRDKACKDDNQQKAAKYLSSLQPPYDMEKIRQYLQFKWFANISKDKAPTSGKEAKEKLEEALQFIAQSNKGVASIQERLSERIKTLSDDIEIPAYIASSVKYAYKPRCFAYFLFEFVEQTDETFLALRDSLPGLKAKKQEQGTTRKSDLDNMVSEEDPIKLARGNQGCVFKAFTSLSGWNQTKGPFACKQFDINAFAEALNALHQIDKKEDEREKERRRLEAKLRFMQGEEDEWKSGDTEEDEPPRIAGDPRIERLKHLLEIELASEYEMAEGESLPYGYQERTIRGFKDLRKEWRKVVKPGDGFSKDKQDRLREVLREFQTNNSERIGSVTLFEKMIDRENWIIWREPDVETAQGWSDRNFADDPSAALLKEHECKERIERLNEPVRLTPADPVYSVRQYPFSDWQTSCKHEPGQLSVRVMCAMRNPDNGLLEPREIRLRYSAPRLIRDRLRTQGDENISNVQWLQPMMEALVPDQDLSQDLRKAPVFLMPVTSISGKRAFYLNFPITIDPKSLGEALGNRRFEHKQDFIGMNNKHFYLRWFSNKGKTPPQWTQWVSFTCLAADLGQRDAAAYAIVEAKRDPGAQDAFRKIGGTDGHGWGAILRQTGLLRLPGEDAMVWRGGGSASKSSMVNAGGLPPWKNGNRLSYCAKNWARIPRFSVKNRPNCLSLN